MHKINQTVDYWPVEVEDFYTAFILQDSNTCQKFIHFVRYNPSKKEIIFDKLLNLSIEKANLQFFNFWLNTFSFSHLLCSPDVHFLPILQKAPELLASSEQIKNLGMEPWVAQVQNLMTFAEYQKEESLLVDEAVQTLSLILYYLPEHEKVLKEHIIDNCISAPASFIQQMEAILDLSQVENQIKLFQGYSIYFKGTQNSQTPSADISFDNIYQVINHYQSKFELLKTQKTSSLDLYWQLKNNPECIKVWVANLEQNSLTNTSLQLKNNIKNIL